VIELNIPHRVSSSNFSFPLIASVRMRVSRCGSGPVAKGRTGTSFTLPFDPLPVVGGCLIVVSRNFHLHLLQSYFPSVDRREVSLELTGSGDSSTFRLVIFGVFWS
jgi:hypothetical protein